jgi:RNA polymerase sigma factor (sigma-70 family)
MPINILDHKNDIYAKAKSAFVRGLEWEDIAQEIFLHLCKVVPKYDPSKASPRTFVLRVATNKIIDLRRHVSAHKRDQSKTVSLDALMEANSLFDIACDPA